MKIDLLPKDFLYMNYFYTLSEKEKQESAFKGFPDEVIARILYEQVRQGNPLNIQSFSIKTEPHRKKRI